MLILTSQDALLNGSQSIPPLTVEEEDAIIHTRITNDERALRRVIKKFHNYTALAHAPIVPSISGSSSNHGVMVEDAREAFLVEVASFQLSLKKSTMICQAEARQVEEYERERTRIEDDHGKLRGQIEQLKTALEHAQVIRRRKIEYDAVTEKVNTLPSREELEQSISSLENDMVAIRSEHDTQNRRIQAQKLALDGVVSDLSVVNLMGKDKDTAGSRQVSPMPTHAPEGDDITMDDDVGSPIEDSALGSEVLGESGEVEKEDGEDNEAASHSLNAAAKPFVPSKSLSRGLEDDIEMGEVAEDPKVKGKKKARDEELEEGEASDSSSALSDPPDD